MKYIIVFTIMSIAGTAGIIFEDKRKIEIEYIDFLEPIIITAGK